jgi:hypothetical protein
MQLRDVVRVFKGPDGKTALDFIQSDGRVYQLQPLPDMDELKPGYYTREFKFITGHPPPTEMMHKGYPEYDENQPRDAGGRWSRGTSL